MTDHLALDEFVVRGRLRTVRNMHLALKVFGGDHRENGRLAHNREASNLGAPMVATSIFRSSIEEP